jgi:hypothetical protein
MSDFLSGGGHVTHRQDFSRDSNRIASLPLLVNLVGLPRAEGLCRIVHERLFLPREGLLGSVCAH